MFSLARTRMTRAISQCGSVRRFAQMQEVKPTLKAFQRDTENEAATEFHRAGNKRYKYSPGDKGGAVMTVAMETTVGECCTFMKRSNIGAVIVMKEGHMAGIFTDRDAVKFVATGSQREQPVQKYMTSAEALYVATAKTMLPKTLHPPLINVNDMMRMVLDYNIRHIPMVDKDKSELLHLISIKDVVNSAVEKLEQEVRDLRWFMTL